jgi:hypothetical protein
VTRPVPPLVVAEPGHVEVYASEDELVGQLEPWYAEEPYEAFDAEGRPLELRAGVEHRVGRLLGPLTIDGPIEVHVLAGADAAPERMAKLLRDQLRRYVLATDGDVPALIERVRLAPPRGPSLAARLVRRLRGR